MVNLVVSLLLFCLYGVSAKNLTIAPKQGYYRIKTPTEKINRTYTPLAPQPILLVLNQTTKTPTNKTEKSTVQENLKVFNSSEEAARKFPNLAGYVHQGKQSDSVDYLPTKAVIVVDEKFNHSLKAWGSSHASFVSRKRPKFDYNDVLHLDSDDSKFIHSEHSSKKTDVVDPKITKELHKNFLEPTTDDNPLLTFISQSHKDRFGTYLRGKKALQSKMERLFANEEDVKHKKEREEYLDSKQRLRENPWVHNDFNKETFW